MTSLFKRWRKRIHKPSPEIKCLIGRAWLRRWKTKRPPRTRDHSSMVDETPDKRRRRRRRRARSPARRGRSALICRRSDGNPPDRRGDEASASGFDHRYPAMFMADVASRQPMATLAPAAAPSPMYPALLYVCSSSARRRVGEEDSLGGDSAVGFDAAGGRRDEVELSSRRSRVDIPLQPTTFSTCFSLGLRQVNNFRLSRAGGMGDQFGDHRSAVEFDDHPPSSTPASARTRTATDSKILITRGRQEAGG